MTLQVTEVGGGKTIEVQVSGKLHKDDYQHFVPHTEELIKKFGKIRVLLLMNDFHGWDLGALWEDTKFDIKHFKDIERVGLVGDKKWEAGMAAFCKPFTTAKVQFFPAEDVAQAREWIQSA